MWVTTACDDRGDPSGAHEATVLVVVVAAVGVDPAGPAGRPAAPATDRRDGVDQGDELGDVVPVPAGQRDREGDPARVGDQMVFAAGPAAIDRARPDVVPPLSARRWDASTTA